MTDEKALANQQSTTPIQQQQPQPTPPMQPTASGLGGNRNFLNKPLDQDGNREWSHGLCSCTEQCGTCCLAEFCPCMVYNQNRSRRGHLERNGIPHPQGGETCGRDAWLYTVLTLGCMGAGVFLLISDRGVIRKRYSISGNLSTDCVTAWLCHACALTQQARELELEEQSSLQLHE
ncbi:hypothetical protein FRC02_004071 [Tulasnella sp. 418]|nr:hypothetical protein FRC02_004071 [Tulasnella sp. 418]